MRGRCSRLVVLLPAVALVVALLVAGCDDGDDAGDEPEPTQPAATAPSDTTAPDTPAPTGDAREVPLESGSEPVFYRTMDEFASLTAGVPYKVVFRVTNGFDEDVLRVVASRDDAAVNFEANRAQTMEEAPGVFYPVNIDLPAPGRWTVSVRAGDDTVSFDVEAAPPEDGGGASDGIDY